jgi:hypothetical protein
MRDMNPIERIFLAAAVKRVNDAVGPLPVPLGAQATLMVSGVLSVQLGVSEEEFVYAARESHQLGVDFAKRVGACDCQSCEAEDCPARQYPATGTEDN